MVSMMSTGDVIPPLGREARMASSSGPEVQVYSGEMFITDPGTK